MQDSMCYSLTYTKSLHINNTSHSQFCAHGISISRSSGVDRDTKGGICIQNTETKENLFFLEKTEKSNKKKTLNSVYASLFSLALHSLILIYALNVEQNNSHFFLYYSHIDMYMYGSTKVLGSFNDLYCLYQLF